MRNVPVIIQMEAVECGAVSLAMILASYGRWVPMDEMRYVCGVSTNGSSARDLLRAGRKFGLEVRGLQMSIDRLHTLREPCIMFVDMEHFIVFRGFLGRYVRANDPATGVVYLSREEFSRRYSGVILTCRPTPAFRKGGSRATSLYFMRKRLQGTREQFLFTFLIALLLTVVSISLPVATQAFTDGVLPGKNPEWGGPMIITLSLLALFQFIVNCLSASYGMKLNARTQICASSSFIWHLLRVPVLFFTARRPGDILLRVNNIANISVTLTTKLAPLVVNLSLLLFYGLFMFRYSAVLSVIVISATILVIIRVFVFTFFQMNMSRRAEVAEGILQSDIMSSIDSIETIKAAGAEEGAFQRWASSFTAASNAKISINKFTEYANAFSNSLIKIAGILVLIVGCSIILEGGITIGMLMAFQGFSTSFTTPVTDVVSVVMTLAGMRSKMERAEDVYRTKCDVKSISVGKGKTELRDKLKGEVELRNVSFGFSAIHEPVVRDFSCHLEPGRSIAIVGASGSGKSTLANIISGMYRPWSGDVLFDGKDLSKWCGDDGQDAAWTLNQDGTMTVDKSFGGIQTRESFGGTYLLHIEWCVPEDIEGENQARGNSGVFLNGIYEYVNERIYHKYTKKQNGGNQVNPSFIISFVHFFVLLNIVFLLESDSFSTLCMEKKYFVRFQCKIYGSFGGIHFIVRVDNGTNGGTGESRMFGYHTDVSSHYFHIQKLTL